MRFSENGYFLESYEKCHNCGVLLYEVAIDANIDGKEKQFCSDWCLNWFVKRDIPQTRSQTTYKVGG